MVEIQVALGLPAAFRLLDALAAADTGYVNRYPLVEMDLDEQAQLLGRRLMVSKGHMGAHVAAIKAAARAAAGAAAGAAATAGAAAAAAATAATPPAASACKNPKCTSMVQGAGYCSLQCMNAPVKPPTSKFQYGDGCPAYHD